jgi:hypothetical protein
MSGFSAFPATSVLNQNSAHGLGRSAEQSANVVITDDPYAETKEQIGGILFLEELGRTCLLNLHFHASWHRTNTFRGW